MRQPREQKRLEDHLPAGFRFAMGGYALISWYDSFTDPQTRMFRLAQTQDGGILVWVMGMLGCVVLMDVLLNDSTPAQISIARWTMPIRWDRVVNVRHFVFFTLAFCWAAHPFIAERSGYQISSSLYFYFTAFLNVLIAFFDAKLRRRSAGWQRAYS